MEDETEADAWAEYTSLYSTKGLTSAPVLNRQRLVESIRGLAVYRRRRREM